MFEIPLWLKGTIFFAYVCLEHWLGSTNIVQANSLIQLIRNIAESMLTWIFKKGKK